MDVLEKLRSKLPPGAIKEKYGVEISGQVRIPVLFVETRSNLGV
jgi:hypothetical protein